MFLHIIFRCGSISIKIHVKDNNVILDIMLKSLYFAHFIQLSIGIIIIKFAPVFIDKLW